MCRSLNTYKAFTFPEGSERGGEKIHIKNIYLESLQIFSWFVNFYQKYMRKLDLNFYKARLMFWMYCIKEFAFMSLVNFYFQTKFGPLPPAPSPVKFSECWKNSYATHLYIYTVWNSAWLANIFKWNPILPLQHFSALQCSMKSYWLSFKTVWVRLLRTMQHWLK